MKVSSAVSKILANKLVLNIVAILALFNVIGYMVMGNLNNVVFFLILAVLVRYFSKNMIVVLGVPLVLVNLVSLRDYGYSREGMKDGTATTTTTTSKDNENTDSDKTTDPAKPVTSTELVGASNDKTTDDHFEVGRPKNGGSKIDYAATIEGAYDQLNSILGSDGIKNLTGDTQRLMQQQADLAKSMESMAPMIEKMMPMAAKAQEMMKSMDTDGKGIGGLMELAKKMSGGLNAAAPRV
ncbi:MAG: hypothetical protein MUP82_05400 [Candidatus Marinimicrobia bacterium]|nr:hypothetical protein [Candidatus Neomarinimicrobiota bacterium]